MTSPAPSGPRPRASTAMAIGVAVLLAVAACLVVGVLGGLAIHKLGHRPVALSS